MAAPPRLLVALLTLLVLALAGCLGAPAAPQAGDGLEPTDAHDHDHGSPAAPAGPNQPPVAAFDWTPIPAVVAQPIVFQDRSTDPDDGVVGRIWEFPDGVTSQLARVTHRFELPGRYLVKLTVSDRAGATHTAAQEVLVVAPGTGQPHEDLGLDPGAHVVVAVIDTGINPYHSAFAAQRPFGVPTSFLEGYPADAQALTLTRGPAYEDARDADEAAWAQVEVGTLYYVPGTRLVGAISFGLGTFGNAAVNQVPILDEDGHGTATASRVAAAGPDVLLVAIESGAQELDQAIAWAANQPWIDIVTVSIGPVGNVPVQYPEYKLEGLALGTRVAWEQGKLVFAAAGNEPTLTTTSYISGPPWVVAVGGVLADGRGDPATASKAMDVVSDYDPEVALHDSTDATDRRAGTSFSAPTVAGTAAEALYQLRAQVGWTRGIEGGLLVGPQSQGLLAEGLTNAELRAALDGVARYWGTGDWAPAAGIPILPAPWVQMGWGYVDGSDAAALAQAVLRGQVPAKPDEARLYMASSLATREAMWG